MDPSQSDSRIKSFFFLMKSFISVERDSSRKDTFVLIDSATTLSFFESDIFETKYLVGKCIHGPKIVVHNALEERDLQDFVLATVFCNNTFF